MCMVVIAGTDELMPPVGSEDAFLFQARPLYPDSASVQRLFSKPHLYDLSSIGGCGCGFRYGPHDLEPQAHEQSRESVRLLQDFLCRAAGTGSVELYSCWSGDESIEPETRQTVSFAHFSGEEFDLVELQFLTVSGG